MKLFSRSGDRQWTTTSDGNKRCVLLHTPELMTVAFAFEKGGVGDAHSHPHVQASYIANGQFEVTIDGNTETLSAGDSFIVPSNAVHGVKALASGVLIDSFTPLRADFL